MVNRQKLNQFQAIVKYSAKISESIATMVDQTTFISNANKLLVKLGWKLVVGP